MMRGVDTVWYAVAVLVAAVSWSSFASANSCDNLGPPLASHALRYEFEISTNETWRQEVLAQLQERQSGIHLIHTDEETWAGLLPRKAIRKHDDRYNWDMFYRMMKHSSKDSKPPVGVLKEVSLHDVTLDPDSVHGRAQLTNLQYILMLDVDRLVWSFRNNSGLPTPGKPYGGWEAPDIELRGHFVGHYLSASAHMWASTHNDTLKARMDAVVTALAECQEKMQSGYLSAFPESFFDRFEAAQKVWAPYYTIHKIMAGLLDQYILADNARALKMVSAVADYFYNRVENLIRKYGIQKHWASLVDEVGGMNDVLYRLYTKTGDEKHLTLARLFDKPCFLGPLASRIDKLSGYHANTHLAIVVGINTGYEVVGDPNYKDMGMFFMDIVNASHSYATGGTSDKEHWQDPMRLADTLNTDNEESCTTYNMLKISRSLFRWTKGSAYADHYERALTNGVLGIQRGEEPGVMVYMLPLGHAVSKANAGVGWTHGWGTPDNSFWCCYGTGIESFSKMGDSIYFEEEGQTPALYVMQYISSSLQWKSGGFSINMKAAPVASYDPRLSVTLTLSLVKDANQTSTLNIRIPNWVSGVVTASYNNETLAVPSPGSFLTVMRKWNSGDILTLELPMAPRLEALKDDRPEFATTQAVLFGPYLLAGLTEDDWAIKTGSGSISDWLKPIPPSYNSHLITLTQAPNATQLALARSSGSIIMDVLPGPGTNESVHATFRLIVQGQDPSQPLASPKEALGKQVTLEPFDLPGTFLVHQGKEMNLTTASAASAGNASVFRLVQGLDGLPETVSLESDSLSGCYVYGGSIEGVKLSCGGTEPLGPDFKKAASFVMQSGVSQFHPISFTANGPKRNYVMQPLQSLTDEVYNVYFDIQP